MDVLTDAVRSLRLRDFKAGTSERRIPWGTYYPRNTWDVVFYAIKNEPCWLTVEGVDAPIKLSDNSICVLPHGHAHAIQDIVRTEAVPVKKYRPDGYYGLMQYGGSEGSPTFVYFGGFSLDRSSKNPLWEALPPVIHIHYKQTPSWLEPVFAWFRDELTERKLGYDSIASRLGELLIIESIRMYIQESADLGAGWINALRDPQLLKVLNLIHANVERPWTVEALAAEVGLSRSRLAARFSAQLNEGPLHYLAYWRMQRAAALLRDTSLSIPTIVQTVGYQSEPSFNAAFKRVFGKPPGRFRQETRQAETA